MGLPDSTYAELLARADFYLNGGLDEAEIIITDLAAALRRRPTRHQVLDVMHQCCRLWNLSEPEIECEACVQRADAVMELLAAEGGEVHQ